MKEKTKNYETELPLGYVEVKTIDVKAKKTAAIFTAVSLLVTAVIGVGGYFLLGGYEAYAEEMRRIAAAARFMRLVIFCVALMAYVVLHELVHGAAYKLLTGQKLTFGVTLSAAYCGVPNIYVYRKASLIALLAPFVLFTVAFALPMFFCRYAVDKLLLCFALGVHLGGCVGDIYGAALYVFKFRDPKTLMRDAGPAQTFYLPEK